MFLQSFILVIFFIPAKAWILRGHKQLMTILDSSLHGDDSYFDEQLMNNLALTLCFGRLQVKDKLPIANKFSSVRPRFLAFVRMIESAWMTKG